MKYFMMIVTAMVVSMTLNSTAAVEKSEAHVTTGSSEQIQSEEKAANSKPVQWSEGFVVWNGGSSYKVLKHAVLPSFKAGTKLGEVSREIDHADVADHRAPEGVRLEDGDSSLPIGTAIHQLAGAPADKVILVEMDGQYYKAVRQYE
ncbi:hypothetical protein [Paenibacillus sp. MDMC362]|uniref:hypothetical protein n=1 Tax=Paenibacillus sp. MDMC362 TaxID=2977365 RepID=UPI000DC37A66|nr:hypothetical protein [Paenibacillus sp. MDMC362]RAR45484.1 hypothetical protein DP091_04125 [Paenibacillus sp. MDMC362]